MKDFKLYGYAIALNIAGLAATHYFTNGSADGAIGMFLGYAVGMVATGMASAHHMRGSK